MDTTQAILVGVASSFIASCFFLASLYLIRPKIEVVSRIAKDVALNGKTFYVIKVLNRSRRAAVDIRAELVLIRYKDVENGSAAVAIDIPLTKSEIFSISKYKKGGQAFGYRFSTFEDIEERWPEDNFSYLTFRIYAKDSLSGLGRVFKQSYRNKNHCIVPGSFGNGESTEIS